MPDPRNGIRARARAPRADGQADARGDDRVVHLPEDTANGTPSGATGPEETVGRARRGRAAEREASDRPGCGGLRGLFRGLRAGDLQTVLLTVEMAADENLLPSADAGEAARILAFLARLARHDAALPPRSPDDGEGAGPDGPRGEAGGTWGGAAPNR